MEGIPVSGQDGDYAALNRVAKGHQIVSVWKDARQLGRAAGRIAVSLSKGTKMNAITGMRFWESPGGTKMSAVFLEPVPVTKQNLSDVVDAGWIPLETLCQGVTAGPTPCN